MVYDPTTLPDNTLDKIEEQIPGLTAVVTDVNQTDPYTGTLTQDEVNEKNQTLVDHISKARDFLKDGHYHNMTTNHLYLIRHAANNPDWARCYVMLVQSIPLFFDKTNKQVYQRYQGVNVYILTGLIYTFSQPYYLNDNDGLQKLVNDLSIKSLNDTQITGREASLQLNEWSHLHGLKVIRDVNPTNGKFETANRNKDRRECDWTLWCQCRCIPTCKYRAERMANLLFFEEMVQRELVMSNGMCPGEDEAGIRAYLRNMIRNYFDDNRLDRPAYLENDNLLTPRYSATNNIGGMRDRVDLSAHNAGILCPAQGRSVKLEDVVMRRATFPHGIIQQIEQAAVNLQPLTTRVDGEVVDDNNEEDDDDGEEDSDTDVTGQDLSQVIIDNSNMCSQATVDSENWNTFRHVCVVACILRMVQAGSIVTASNFTGGGEIPPTEEELADECWFKNSALGDGSQQADIVFNNSGEWLTGRAVNDWITANKPGNRFKPRLARTMKIAEIVYNYWTTVWNGDLRKCLHYFSILSPPVGISPILANYQRWEASHLAHLSLLLTDSARCLNTTFITNEHNNSNLVRTCSKHPWRPFLEECQHIPTCKQCIFKLTEGRLVHEVNMAYLNRQLGGPFHDSTWLEIEAVYLDIFRRAFEAAEDAEVRRAFEVAEGAEVPDWLEARCGNNELGQYTVWPCDHCGLEFSTKKEAEEHEAEEHGEEEEQEAPPVRDVEFTSYSRWGEAEWLNYAAGMIYWKGHRTRYAEVRRYMMRQNQTMNLQRQVCQNAFNNDEAWTTFKVRHDIVQLFEACTGGVHGCQCALHTDARFQYTHTT